MTRSSRIVSESLLNRYYATLVFGRMRFRMYQPFIKDLARAFSGFRLNSIDKTDYPLDAIARLLFRQKWKQSLFTWYATRFSNYEQIRRASKKIADIITGKDLIEAVKVDKTRKKTITETVGNNTVAGVMATAMEYLNITYKEAFEQINYPTILLMMIDKMHSLIGDEQKVVKGNGKEMAARRKHK